MSLFGNLGNALWKATHNNPIIGFNYNEEIGMVGVFSHFAKDIKVTSKELKGGHRQRIITFDGYPGHFTVTLHENEDKVKSVHHVGINGKTTHFTHGGFYEISPKSKNLRVRNAEYFMARWGRTLQPFCFLYHPTRPGNI